MSKRKRDDHTVSLVYTDSNLEKTKDAIKQEILNKVLYINMLCNLPRDDTTRFKNICCQNETLEEFQQQLDVLTEECEQYSSASFK